MTVYKDIGGCRFGKLLVTSPYGSNKNGRKMWLCLCDCGNEKIICSANLLRKDTESCGCIQRRNSVKHGHAIGVGTKTYITWKGMIQRCSYKGHSQYKYYGQRGINVCERWKIFENFLDDMGERPDGMSIDRINNNGNYCPDNCRWVTAVEQQKNKRRRVYKRKVINIFDSG